jgi:chromosome segregation ATPase
LKEEAQNDNVENPVDEEKDKAEALEEVDHSDETTEPDEHDLGKEAEEGAQGIDETPDADEEISKKIDSLKDAVQTSLEKTRKETAEQVAALEKKIAENNEAFLSKVSDLENKFSEFGEELKTAKAKTAELEKSLDALNNEGSFKKSGDVETTSEGTVQKANTWNGAFSIDNLLK